MTQLFSTLSHRLSLPGRRWRVVALLLMLFSPSLSAGPARVDEPIQPLPLSVSEHPGKVALGQRLFHDPRLSRDDTVSCAHCHPLGRAGVDGLPVSFGVQGALGSVNTPTVFNSRYNFVQFWDGRAKTLEAQVEHPIHNEQEQASSWRQVIGKLSADSSYVQAFQLLYGELNQQAIRDAIATFERTLITPNARFDQYLRGDDQAITEEELRGYELFKAYGCTSCHQGMAVGGNMFEKLGIVRDYFSERGSITAADWGRFNVTGNEENRFEFKVPGLRNVELTAPYFHDGSATTLEAAVETMARYQLGRELPTEDRDLIVAFLKTLTGELETYSP